MGIMTKLQARARGKLMRVEFQKMYQRVRASRCIQRNIRKFCQFRDWNWWKLLTKVKPLLNTVKAEDELKAKAAEMAEVAENLAKEQKLRKEYETKCVSLLSEKNNLVISLQAEQENLADSEERNEQLIKAKQVLETELAELNERLEEEEGNTEYWLLLKRKWKKQTKNFLKILRELKAT